MPGTTTVVAAEEEEEAAAAERGREAAALEQMPAGAQLKGANSPPLGSPRFFAAATGARKREAAAQGGRTGGRAFSRVGLAPLWQ